MVKKVKNGAEHVHSEDLTSALKTKLGDLVDDYGIEEILEAVEQFKNLIPVGEQIWKTYRKDAGKAIGLLVEIVLDITEELQPVLARGHVLDAKRRGSYLSALVKEGFTREEAMQILLAQLKPLDFSSLTKSVAKSAKKD